MTTASSQGKPGAPDEARYAELVEPMRGELRAHCYRMLASAADADDALQETMLRAWRGLGGFEERSSLRTWLYRIATNVCLRQLEGRPRRLLASGARAPSADPSAPVGGADDEVAWIEPFPDLELIADPAPGPAARFEQLEAVELAFVAALQHLPPAQRSVLVLRDVLGFSARETGDILGRSPAAVDSALQRAHRTVEERLPARSQQQARRDLGDPETRALVDRLAAAWARNDVDAVVAELRSDARLTMPPIPTWFSGTASIRAFLLASALSDRKQWRTVVASASGQPAFAGYLLDDASGRYLPWSLNVVDLADGGVQELTCFHLPDAFPRFGLPQTLTT